MLLFKHSQEIAVLFKHSQEIANSEGKEVGAIENSGLKEMNNR